MYNTFHSLTANIIQHYNLPASYFCEPSTLHAATAPALAFTYFGYRIIITYCTRFSSLN